MQQLTIGNIINEAIQIGLKNMISLLGAVVLWLLTIWIPYLNVGTTIGLFAIVLAMSRDEVFSPGEIFDPKYRKYMGEFFLLMGFIPIQFCNVRIEPVASTHQLYPVRRAKRAGSSQ